MREKRLEVSWTDHHASCIFEPFPTNELLSKPSLRTSYEDYKIARTSWPLSPSCWKLLFESEFTDFILSLLGPSAVLFNEQYIIKPSRSGDSSRFAWHRDSDYGDFQRPFSFLSVWLCLDDVSESNGCLVICPESHRYESSESVEMKRTPPVNDLLIKNALEIQAGSAVLLVNSVVHGSGGNSSAFSRRVWMPQFSAQPVLRDSNGQLAALAIPLRRA